MPAYSRTTTLLAGLAAALTALMIWGGLQHDDPLAPYIHADSMRHILGFGTLGLCAALAPGQTARALALAGVLAFALVFEILQGPFSPREASFRDLFNSCIGAFAGFGFGAAALSARIAARVGLAHLQARLQSGRQATAAPTRR
jgi:hypothetical protein